MAKKAAAPKSRAKSSHGGQRPGAGRPTKTATKLRAEIIAEADKAICDNLPKLIANMIYLANGGYERVEEKHTDDEGLGILSLTERKITIAEPDRGANQYLIDRILGKPKQAIEINDVTTVVDAVAEMNKSAERYEQQHGQGVDQSGTGEVPD